MYFLVFSFIFLTFAHSNIQEDMKKNIKNALRLMLLVGALFTTSSAFAQDVEELLLDHEYEISGYVFRTYYYFVPTANGTLITYGPGNMSHYADEEFTEQISDVTNGYDENYNHISSMTVEAGETYYLLYYCLESSYSFYAHLYTTEEKPELTTLLPEEGTVLYLTDTNDAMISWQFSRPVEFGTITLSAGKEGSMVSQSGFNSNFTNGFYSISVKDCMLEWLREGVVEGGDPVVLTIADIHAEGDESCVYGEDGTMRAEWVSCDKPVELSSGVWPEKFLSWWAEGDEAGIVTLTFDAPILSFDDGQSAQCTLGFGSRDEEGGYYTESITNADNPGKIVINDNTIKVDLTGKSRTRDDMLPGFDTSEFTTMSISVQLVKAADGTYCYSEIMGGLGSYSKTLEYEEVEVGDDTGISKVTTETKPLRRYNTAGQMVNARAKGINIVESSDGSVKKIYVK